MISSRHDEITNDIFSAVLSFRTCSQSMKIHTGCVCIKNMPSKRKFTFETVDLIEAVESKKCLWDKRCDEYKDRNLKDREWKEVCRLLEPKFDDIEKDEQKEIGKFITFYLFYFFIIYNYLLLFLRIYWFPVSKKVVQKSNFSSHQDLIIFGYNLYFRHLPR